MKKNKKYTIGMIVKKDGVIGIVDSVGGELDGKKASVIWFNGDTDAWWELNELEILEDPAEKYRKAYKQKRVVMTSETGEQRSCKYDTYAIIETLSDFLEYLGDYPEDYQCVDDYVIDVMEEGCKNFAYPYFYTKEDNDNDENAHFLRIKIVG